MKYNDISNKPDSIFRRMIGVKKQTFELMLKILVKQYEQEHKLEGASSKLGLEDKLLMMLSYWQEYQTYFYIGNEYGYSESQAYKIIR